MWRGLGDLEAENILRSVLEIQQMLNTCRGKGAPGKFFLKGGRNIENFTSLFEKKVKNGMGNFLCQQTKL